MLRLPAALALVLLAACEATSRAHHKVHNLALYPERHSWCQATPIRQEIASSDPECAPTTIDNVVCLGACFSYAVPRAQDDVLIEPYCDACRPTQAAWTVISLNCTRALTGERYLAPKNVELIANCSCVDCNSGARAAHGGDEDDSAADSGEVDESAEGDALHLNSVLPAPLDAMKNEEEDEGGRQEAEVSPGPHHHLHSVSAEQRRTAEEDLMIKDNKISPDDDDDDGAAHQRHHGK